MSRLAARLARAQGLAWGGLALAAWLAAQSSAPPQPDTAVRAVEAVALSVADLERSVAFFTDVLEFRKAGERELGGDGWEHLQGVFGLRTRTARLRLGAEVLELREALAPRGRAMPGDSRSHDRWFQHVAIITSDMDQAYARLRARGVEHSSTSPQRLPDWNPNAGGIRAFYFKDPDGHPLEVLWFPEGKGAAKWHAETKALFLGIDHTAIVVGDTDASLAFWRDRLGMRVVGASENYGPEQERLNHVFGARLRITTLRADGGPGVELLEYLTPGGGKPMPEDSRANDLWQWEVVLALADPAAAVPHLRAGKARFVSSDVVTLDGREQLVVRDPDGHAVQLVGRLAER